jgi:hypothetical protein
VSTSRLQQHHLASHFLVYQIHRRRIICSIVKQLETRIIVIIGRKLTSALNTSIRPFYIPYLDCCDSPGPALTCSLPDPLSLTERGSTQLLYICSGPSQSSPSFSLLSLVFSSLSANTIMLFLRPLFGAVTEKIHLLR